MTLKSGEGGDKHWKKKSNTEGQGRRKKRGE